VLELDADKIQLDTIPAVQLSVLDASMTAVYWKLAQLSKKQHVDEVRSASTRRRRLF